MPTAVKAARAPAGGGGDGSGIRRRLAFSGRVPAVLLLVLIVVLAGFLVDLLKRRALQSAYFRVDPGLIEFGPLPEAIPEKVAAELQVLTQVEPRSIFDRGLIDDLRSSVSRHPWVKDVADVRRVLPNRLVLDLRLRVPFAVVDVGAWRLTVDAEGYVLEDHASLAPEDLPRIRGDKKSIPRIPRVGSPFRCEPVTDGLEVAADMRENVAHPLFHYVDLVAIDVSNVGTKAPSEIVLELSSGTLVDWGSARSGALGAIEMRASQKLDNLLLVHDQNPGLQGVMRVDAAAKNPLVTLAR